MGSRVIPRYIFSRQKLRILTTPEKGERERTRGSRLSAINLAIGSRWRIVVLPAPPQYLIRAIRADTRSGQLLGTRMEATLVFLVAVQRPRGLFSGLGYIWI